MQQTQLLLSNRVSKDISDEVILKCPDFLEALRLCKSISGLTDLQLAQELEIEQAHWSRIWSGQAHFPPKKIPKFMDLCGNEVPLRWMSLTRGYELRRMKSQVEIENETLRSQLEQERTELAAIKKFMAEIRAR